MSQVPHRDVAERFRYFLAAVGLTREEFAAAIDGAIEARSLFSVLNGNRRPSRALAVLIERSWGFRADFLLEGEGEMWTKPAYGSGSVGGAMLSPGEAAVVDFMRSSVENASAVDNHLHQAWIWARLEGHLNQIAESLEACADDGSDESLRAYPPLTALLFEDCSFLAARYERIVALEHRERVHQLFDRLLERFGREIPRDQLGDDASALEALLEPLCERRRSERLDLRSAIENARQTVEGVLAMPRLEDRARNATRPSHLARHRELIERLSESAPAELSGEAEELVAALAREPHARLGLRERLKRVLARLLAQPAVAPSTEPAYDSERLNARYDDLLEPLAS